MKTLTNSGRSYWKPHQNTNSGRFYWKPHKNFQWCVSLLFFLVFTTYTGGVSKGIGILNQTLKMPTGEADCHLSCVLRLLYNSFFSLMPQVCLSQMPGSVDTTLCLCGPRLVCYSTAHYVGTLHIWYHCSVCLICSSYFVQYLFSYYWVKSPFFLLFLHVTIFLINKKFLKQNARFSLYCKISIRGDMHGFFRYMLC